MHLVECVKVLQNIILQFLPKLHHEFNTCGKKASGKHMISLVS